MVTSGAKPPPLNYRYLTQHHAYAGVNTLAATKRLDIAKGISENRYAFCGFMG